MAQHSRKKMTKHLFVHVHVLVHDRKLLLPSTCTIKGVNLLPPLKKLSVSHIFYWTRGNVVNHVKVKLFSHIHCEGPPLSVIARSPLLVRFAHTLRTGDEAISSLMRKRRDCHARYRGLAMT
jgi:hypothetical protein